MSRHGWLAVKWCSVEWCSGNDDARCQERKRERDSGFSIERDFPKATMMDRTRIPCFWRKPPAPTNGSFKEENVLSNLIKSSQQQRYIPESPDRILDAPDLIDDYYLNLLEWSARNIVAIVLKNTMHLWNASGLARSS
ncbi:hypothetical protein MRB53_016567 [Persea americana]|uniref:Uncharacterized protein n=1 Tax=Persea americana TaxID=3435 RepID=A0ACC2M384_PERAE|nr:hypothetical protein MRB53_016567 [Persea americana]